ncbi:MAG: exonuclease SbcCD subunit D [Oscillospiraceae bacterium]|nr:exonuclease SbcCD subunit D [Oscillospiraceae bacterium]
MRLMHLADLHLGKILFKRSLLNDQHYILQQILEIAAKQDLDGVLIAGDLYQRNTPAADAMTELSSFLTALHELGLPVYIVSGNHDSAERLAYLSSIAEKSGIYIASPDAGEIRTIPFEDAYGKGFIHLLSFCTPLQIRQRFREQAESIDSYDDAAAAVLNAHEIDTSVRNIMVAHQFITGAETSGSEEMSVGGSENIRCSLFDAYDYVALGHLHGPQRVGRDTVRYAGSPLKYSFSETGQKKSVTIVELREKGSVTVEQIPLTPLHDMTELTGTFDALMEQGCKDYVHITLTDEEPPVDAAKRLRHVFPNLLQTTVRNAKFREDLGVSGNAEPQKDLGFLSMVHDFYAFRNNGAKMSDPQLEIIHALLEEMNEEEAGD